MRKRLLALAAIVILTIPLAWLLRDFVRDVFLVELGRAIWAVRILFESLPQVLIWGALVVALLVLAARTLRPRSRTLPGEAHGPTASLGRVQVLSRWIDRSAKSEYFRQSLAHYLAGLAWEAMAHREHTSSDRMKQRMRADELDLPPQIGEILRAGQTPAVPTSTGFFSRLWQRLAPGRSAGSGRSSGGGLDPTLEPLIGFLEDQLEIRAGPRPGAGATSSPEDGARTGWGGRNSGDPL